MTREEAVVWLKHIKKSYTNLDICDVFCNSIDMAIEAPQEPEGKWIPVSERLPENTDDEFYPMSLVTLDNGDVCLGVYRHDEKAWRTRMSEGELYYTTDHKVTAWQPLPEPYKAGDQDD